MTSDLKAKQKLQWLGLSNAAKSLSNVEDEIEILRKNHESYSEFQGNIDDDSMTSFENFKSYILNRGFDSDQADAFIEKIKHAFTDEDDSGTVFDEFKGYIVQEAESWSDLKSAFGSSSVFTSNTQTESGTSAAGIKFHETAGVTRNGVSVPAGTTEVFGREVHFSQAEAPEDGDSHGSGNISFSNLRSDPAENETVLLSDTVTIKADVTNGKSISSRIVVSLIEDGAQIDSKQVSLSSGETRTVSFDVTYYSPHHHTYSIEDTGEITITWVPYSSVHIQ